MSIRNLRALLQPRSVALIGADGGTNTVGAVIARNLVSGGFAGPVLPVSAQATAVYGILAYPDVASLPVVPDLAVVLSPPEEVPGVIDHLAARGTRAAVVIPAGFADRGAAGEALQQQMLDAARPHLLRLIGPNCMGIAAPAHGLNASFLAAKANPGGLAFVSQSGAVLSTVVDWAAHRGVGFSYLVSLGDMADVDFGDMLDYLASDAHTRAVVLHMEAVRNARKFLSAARAVARNKPVVVLKAGRTAAGARAVQSHTGALAGEAEVYEAAFGRAGMLQVHSLGEMFSAVETLGMGLRVRGDRLAILSNGGGLAVLAVDRMMERGLRLADLDEETAARLAKATTSVESEGNPVDIGADATPDDYKNALGILLEEPEADAFLVINGPTGLGNAKACAAAVADVAKAKRRPVLTSWLGLEGAEGSREAFTAAKVPTYDTPDEAIEGFCHLVAHQRNQLQLLEVPTALRFERQINTARAREICATALADGREWLTEVESKQVLEAYAVPVVRTLAAQSPEDAGKMATRLGTRVALKIASPDLPHKSDVGGVQLDLDGADAVTAAAERMLDEVRKHAPEARIEGFAVAEMATLPGGVETIAGAKTDPVFGPVILFGAGGLAVELLRDRAVALPPLNLELARRLIERTHIARLLEGYRTIPAADRDTLALTLVKLSQLMIQLDLVDELDINPLMVNAHGVLALDARIRVAEPPRVGTARLAIKPYPRELEKRVSLRDGTPVHLRPIRPADATDLQEMIGRINLDDLRMRFFSAMKQLPPALAARLTQIDYDREMAFVATADNGEADGMWGVGRLHADADLQRAEYAVLVRSDLGGRGLGLRLMQEIIEHGRRLSVQEIFGEVLAENTRMLAMCDRLGFVRHKSDDPDVVHVTLDMSSV